jgi:hypothetical protein
LLPIARSLHFDVYFFLIIFMIFSMIFFRCVGSESEQKNYTRFFGIEIFIKWGGKFLLCNSIWFRIHCLVFSIFQKSSGYFSHKAKTRNLIPVVLSITFSFVGWKIS